jgi:hypothetical protein
MTPETFRDYIEDLSTVFIVGDFERWAQAVDLPLTRVTRTGIRTTTTLDELRADFDAFVILLREAGVTRVRRLVQSVDVMDDGQMLATYDTELLRTETELGFQPYTSSMLMRRDGTGPWRCISVMNSVGLHPDPAAPGTLSIARTPESAKAIYQQSLDDSAHLMMTGQYDRLNEVIAIPHTIATLDLETTLGSGEILAKGVSAFIENLRTLGMTDYIRICSAAQFVSATQIEGAHRTYVISSGLHLVPPYKCEMTFQLLDGAWKCRRGYSHILNHVCGIVSPLLQVPSVPTSRRAKTPD